MSHVSMLGNGIRRMGGFVFGTTSVSREQALSVLERLSALTHAAGSAEQLANHHERRTGGVNDWTIARAAMAYRNPFMRALTDRVAEPNVTNIVHLCRLTAGLLLATPYGSNRTRSLANAVCIGAQTLVAPRHYYGADGSDHVALMSQALTLISRVTKRDAVVTDAVLWLASMQAVMSYAVSGWVKLAGDKWRNDEALPGVMRTRVYGNEWVWRQLRRHPLAAKFLGRATLVLECSYPIIYAGGGRLARPLMFGSAFMHLNIAWTMGLGRFVTAFLSMYGAMAYTVQPRDAAGDERNDGMAHVAAVGAAVAITLFAATGLRRRAEVLRGAPGERRLTTSTGATVSYREHGDPARETLFVLENGLMAPSGFWGWVVDGLQEHGSVLTYHRAGYGSSTPGPGERDFDTLVDDLESVIRSRADGRRVVLVGHSIGGYLAHRLVERHPELVDLCVLVDPTHPDELKRSGQQRLGSETLVPSLQLTYWSLLLGLGPLIERPVWAHQLKPEEREETLRIFHDARLWGAALDEWRAVTDQFDRVNGTPSLSRPALVLTAHATIASDSDMAQLHREFAETSVGGRHVVLDNANHESILTSQSISSRTVSAIVGFIAECDDDRKAEAV